MTKGGNNLIDLHTHLLPGVDDGVQNEAEALETVRRALVADINRIVATPHVSVTENNGGGR